MVGRVSAASLLLLAVAAFATSPPLNAEPVHLIDAPLALLATASAASASEPAPGAPSNAVLDSGEVGVKHQLSVHAAESFLDRLPARWKRLVEQAMTYLGTPYVRGGTSRRGLDCSGLVGAVYGEEGLGLPRTAAQQFAEGAPVAERDLRPGDLVFFRDTYKRGISHVGIYIGDGRFVHAAGRRRGVVVSELSSRYYRLRYAGARRLAVGPQEPDLAERPAAADLAAPAPALAAPEPAAAAAAPVTPAGGPRDP
jgi:cell wall-associated NlpC family hydrolase